MIVLHSDGKPQHRSTTEPFKKPSIHHILNEDNREMSGDRPVWKEHNLKMFKY